MEARSLLPFNWGGSRPLRSTFEADPFAALHREMNRMFEEFGRGFPTLGGPAAGFAPLPRIDMRETDKELLVSVELPGVAEKDVEVTIKDDLLTVKGEKRSEIDEKRENVHLMERSYGAFQRVVTLPFAADPNLVRASFAKGVLTVAMPRPPAEQTKTRRIEIKPAG
jgi:HSP20 family protein